MHGKAWAVLLGTAGTVLAADQISKAWVTAVLPLHEQIAPVPALAAFFTLTHTRNTGAAFSLFPEGGLFLTLIGLVTVGLILFYMRQLAGYGWPLQAALALVLGGTLGNLLDRVRLGFVVDFLHVHGLPVFNVADVAIAGGVALLILLVWWAERTTAAQSNSEG